MRGAHLGSGLKVKCQVVEWYLSAGQLLPQAGPEGGEALLRLIALRREREGERGREGGNEREREEDDEPRI